MSACVCVVFDSGAAGSQALAPCGLQLWSDLAQCLPGVRQCLRAPLRAARASKENRGGCRPEGLGPGLCCEALPGVIPESQSYPYKWRPSPPGRAWRQRQHMSCARGVGCSGTASQDDDATLLPQPAWPVVKQ